MKYARIILNAGAVIATVCSVFAFTSKRGPGTVFTFSNSTCSRVACSQSGTGATCAAVTYYATSTCSSASNLGKVATRGIIE